MSFSFPFPFIASAKVATLASFSIYTGLLKSLFKFSTNGKFFKILTFPDVIICPNFLSTEPGMPIPIALTFS